SFSAFNVVLLPSLSRFLEWSAITKSKAAAKVKSTGTLPAKLANWSALEARARKIPNNAQLRLACDRVGLHYLMPLDGDTLGLEQVDLLTHGRKRDERVLGAVRDQEPLLQCHR